MSHVRLVCHINHALRQASSAWADAGVGQGRAGMAAGAMVRGPQRRRRQARRRGCPPLAAL